MKAETRSLVNAGLVQLAVAVIGGLVVWYSVVEVKIAKAESVQTSHSEKIDANTTAIRELVHQQKAREVSIRKFYETQWPQVGLNAASIDALREVIAEIKVAQAENRKLLLRILQKVK